MIGAPSGRFSFATWVGFEPEAHINKARSDYVYVASRLKGEANPTRGARIMREQLL